MKKKAILRLLDSGLLTSEEEKLENYTELAFGLNMDMIYVEGSTFKMGATEEQGKATEKDEHPVRTVKMDSYYIGKHLITRRQWNLIMEPDSFFDDETSKTEEYPVCRVSWNEAQEFCARLSKKTGKRYVLPTEAQWEYAARGGKKSKGYKYAGSNNLDEVAWYKGNSGDGKYPIGCKKANELGIYDMNGNLFEWCSDWYSYGYYDYTDYDIDNPQGAEDGSYRVCRGGSWRSDAENCRVSKRDAEYPHIRDSYFCIGFRVAVLL